MPRNNAEYKITNAITEGLVVDGLSTIELFCLSSISTKLLPGLLLLNTQQIIKLSIINIVASSIGYYLEANTLTNHGIFAYAEGGAAEYLSKHAIVTISNLNEGNFYQYDLFIGIIRIIPEATLGALNHVEYASFNHSGEHINSKIANIAVAINIEAAEMAYRGIINGEMIEQGSIGGVIGLLEAVNSIFLLPRAKELAYQIVDYIYQFESESLMPNTSCYGVINPT